jgi:hypothetical protein
VIVSPGGDEEGGEQAVRTTPAPAETETEAQTQTEAPAPPKPEVTRIRIRGGEVVGGAPDITVESGDVIRIVVTSDAPDDIHLHGYDVTRKAGPGQPARFRVKADLEGSFEIESHVAEDAGRDPLVARLNVEPG